MDKNSPPVNPFKNLGLRLKSLRSQSKESLAEVSGAVEIDVKQLASYELGHSRPTEDILLLLISHFRAKDEDALKLWELAGYSSNSPEPRTATVEINLEQIPTGFVENRVLFTDIVDVIVNNYGVVMNFMQNTGPNSRPMPVAKVGMSREHAKSVLKILQVTLAQTERTAPKLPKRIIAPKNKSQDENHKK